MIKFSQKPIFIIIILLTVIIFYPSQDVSAITCGISFPSGNPINFGDIARDGISAEQTLQIENTGDTTGALSVYAKDWKSNDIMHIPGENTKFGNSTRSGLDYTTEMKATNNTSGSIEMGKIFSSSTNSTYWRTSANNMDNLPFSGSITQEITFTMTC